MFDLGWSKVIILAVVAIVVVGPKELPSLLRTLGQFIAQLRRHAADFRAQFDEAMRSTELDQIRRDVEAIKTDAHASLRGIEQSLEKDVNEHKTSLEQAIEGPGSPSAGSGGEQHAASEVPPAAEGSASPASAPLPEPPEFAMPSLPPLPAAEPALEPAVLPGHDADAQPHVPARRAEKTGAGA